MKSRCSKSYEFRTLLTPHCLVLFGFLKTKEKKNLWLLKIHTDDYRTELPSFLRYLTSKYIYY